MSKNVKELFDLSGKTAIVTGGSRGIGKEMAEGLAEAGATLMLCARRQEWLDETVAEFAERVPSAAGASGSSTRSSIGGSPERRRSSTA